MADTKTAPKAPKADKTQKTTKPAAEKAAPKQKSTGLRKPQVRILAYLAKIGKAAGRKDIAAGAACDLAWLNSWVGSNDDAVRAKNDTAEFPSLVTLKFVRFAAPESGTGTAYEITAAGRKALEKASK